MRVAREDVEVKMQIPGAVIRQRTDFGDATGLGKMSGEYFSLAAGVDTAPLFEGLVGDLCQCPHWGYVLSGELVVTYTDGKVETCQGSDLFHWPPGHSVRVVRDAEVILFSPEREPVRSWRELPTFWAKLVEVPGGWYLAKNRYDQGGWSTDAVFGAMIDSRQVHKLPVGWLLLLLIIYLLDISGSMSQMLGDKRRVEIVSDALQEIATEMVARSTKGELVSPRYRLVIRADAQDLGRGSESLAAVISGDPIEIAFNVRYLLEGLKAMGADQVVLQCNAPTTPAVLVPVDDEDAFTYLVMPVQIRSWAPSRRAASRAAAPERSPLPAGPL